LSELFLFHGKGQDGSNQVQLIFDELNNWFPHVLSDNNMASYYIFSWGFLLVSILFMRGFTCV